MGARTSPHEILIIVYRVHAHLHPSVPQTPLSVRQRNMAASGSIASQPVLSCPGRSCCRLTILPHSRQRLRRGECVVRGDYHGEHAPISKASVKGIGRGRRRLQHWRTKVATFSGCGLLLCVLENRSTECACQEELRRGIPQNNEIQFFGYFGMGEAVKSGELGKRWIARNAWGIR
jgi:hypothetical protein